MKMQMEDFYSAEIDADVLIYNGTIEGELTSIDELVKKNNELVSKPTEKIKKIDNTKILYIEESPDIEKSKIIIRGIHEAYNKEIGEKK